MSWGQLWRALYPLYIPKKYSFLLQFHIVYSTIILYIPYASRKVKIFVRVHPRALTNKILFFDIRSSFIQRGQWLSQLCGALVAHEVTLASRALAMPWWRYSHSCCWVSMDHDPVEISIMKKLAHVLWMVVYVRAWSKWFVRAFLLQQSLRCFSRVARAPACKLVETRNAVLHAEQLQLMLYFMIKPKI